MLVRGTLTYVALLASASAVAQTPGEWKYTIATDLTKIPADMRVNFPTISFAVCRTEADFASGRAFALQTLASSEARCPSTQFERIPNKNGRFDSLQFGYACDGGSTLSGRASGRVEPSKFSLALESRYSPSVNGVETISQTMTATRVGPCKVKPDSDLLKVQ
jgi:hypothetical protein